MQIKCLDSLPLHLPRTYHDVGEFACGQVGRVMVSAVTTLEYFGYACMQLILLWHQMEVGTLFLVQNSKTTKQITIPLSLTKKPALHSLPGSAATCRYSSGHSAEPLHVSMQG